MSDPIPMNDSTKDDDQSALDVVDLLLAQHSLIRDLFAEVAAATGDARRDAFGRLVRLLAVHETAEEQVVHPMARQSLNGTDGGAGVVDDRLTEERAAKEVLSRLEDVGPDDAEFPTLLAQLRQAVLAHAANEENYEFRYLRQKVDPARLRAAATAVRAAEAVAPTHPHPGVESAAANLTIGPIVAMFDRTRDLVKAALEKR